jgi:tetratricopeptide (TPR) repeat protein
MALVNQGKYDEGIARYRDALRIQADFADAHNNLGVALANQGKYDEAIDHFSEALRIRPDYSSARENLRLAREIRNRQ